MRTVKVSTGIEWCEWGSTYDRLLATNDWSKEELEVLKAHRNIIDSTKDPEEIMRVLSGYRDRSGTRDICVDYALLGPEHMTFDLSSGKKYRYSDRIIGVFFGSRKFPLEPLSPHDMEEAYYTYTDEIHNCSAVRAVGSGDISKFLTSYEQTEASFLKHTSSGGQFEDFRNFNHMLVGDSCKFESDGYVRGSTGELRIGEERGREIARGIVEYQFDWANENAYSKTVSYSWRNDKLRATLLNIIDKGIFYSFADKQNASKTA